MPRGIVSRAVIEVDGNNIGYTLTSTGCDLMPSIVGNITGGSQKPGDPIIYRSFAFAKVGSLMDDDGHLSTRTRHAPTFGSITVR
jgi:hypothetical protein